TSVQALICITFAYRDDTRDRASNARQQAPNTSYQRRSRRCALQPPTCRPRQLLREPRQPVPRRTYKFCAPAEQSHHARAKVGRFEALGASRRFLVLVTELPQAAASEDQPHDT